MARRTRLGVLALSSLLALGCTSGDGGNHGRLRLVEVSDAVVAKGLGPAIVSANGTLYVGYGAMEGDPPMPILRLATVTTDLTVENDMQAYSALPGSGSQDLASADIRMSRKDNCSFWYAYEVVERTGTVGDLETAHAVAAEYDVCAGPAPALSVSSSSPIANSVEGDLMSLPVGTELVNDPTPFVVDGGLHVATRFWMQTRFRVFPLDSSLAAAESWELSLDGILTSDMAHQNAIVPHSTGAWLVQQESDGPVALGGTSDLVAVSLNPGVAAGLEETRLSTCSDYEVYSIGALADDNLLYVGYQVSTGQDVRPGAPEFLPRLKVFEPTRAFELVDAINLEPGGAAGERVTVEVVGGFVFIAYLATQTDEIRVKKFEWQAAPAAWAPTACP